jgi:hypothetical protein
MFEGFTRFVLGPQYRGFRCRFRLSSALPFARACLAVLPLFLVGLAARRLPAHGFTASSPVTGDAVGRGRAALRRRASSDGTCIKAASHGLNPPQAASATPMPSTGSIPVKWALMIRWRHGAIFTVSTLVRRSFPGRTSAGGVPVPVQHGHGRAQHSCPVWSSSAPAPCCSQVRHESLPARSFCLQVLPRRLNSGLYLGDLMTSKRRRGVRRGGSASNRAWEGLRNPGRSELAGNADFLPRPGPHHLTNGDTPSLTP